MTKTILILAVLYCIDLGAIAQSVAVNKPADNDTLFLFVYETDSVYITSNDVKSQKNGKYFLTAEKFFQLDNIHVQLGHCCVSLYEKSLLGIWERIWVQHPWDNILPPGRKLWIDLKESFITTDGVPFFKVVTRKGSSGYFKIIN